MRGLFISFEGPEGGGKSTHAARLVERLNAQGVEILSVREPGGTPTGEAIREILQHDRTGEPICTTAELMLFAASRAQLVAHVIRPALERGEWVLCDRFADSTTAYQGYGRGYPLDQIAALNEAAVNGLWPDVTLLLDLDVEHGFSRIASRYARSGGEQDRFERESRDFHHRIREGYLDLARANASRIRVVDAGRTMDEVSADIWRIVQEVAAARGITS